MVVVNGNTALRKPRRRAFSATARPGRAHGRPPAVRALFGVNAAAVIVAETAVAPGRLMTQAPDSPLPFPVPQYSKAPMTVPYGDRQGFNFRSSTRPHCDRLRRRQRYGGSPICR
jgi:hypothetical protein